MKLFNTSFCFQTVSGGGWTSGQVVSRRRRGLRVSLMHRQPRGQQPADLLQEILRPYTQAGKRGAQVMRWRVKHLTIWPSRRLHFYKLSVLKDENGDRRRVEIATDVVCLCLRTNQTHFKLLSRLILGGEAAKRRGQQNCRTNKSKSKKRKQNHFSW